MNNSENKSNEFDDELKDNWLNDNLKLIQMEPPLTFTQRVIEKIEAKPNPLSNSPIFWILAVMPGSIIVWLILFAIYSVSSIYQFNLTFLPNISNIISLFALSKYVLMILLGGLFLFGLDFFINKNFSHGKSIFSFVLV